MPQVILAVQGFAAKFAATKLGAFLTTNIIGRLLVSVALSALQAALMKQPKAQQAGIRTTQTQTGGITPASFIVGKYATEGQLAAPTMSHGNAGGTPNAYLTYVIELGDIPGQTLESVILDGEVAPLGETPHADYGTPLGGRFEGHAWIKYYDGTQTVADPMLLDKYGTDPDRPWTADMVGEGICYAILTFLYNREIYTSFPGARFVMGGIPLYDPRKDTSVGGAGTHRWADRASWEPSENVAVQAYNVFRGIDLGGGHRWGGRADADDLPLDVWWAGMNISDTAIGLVGDGSEPQYRAGYEIFANDEPASVLETMMRGCHGKLAESGGIWKIRMGGPGLPVYFIEDDDVIISDTEVSRPFSADEDVFNGVHATYPDPETLWEPKEAPARYNDTYEAQDGGQRNVADLTFSATPYPMQVQRVMRAYIEDERRFRQHVLSLPPDAIPLEPLDTVARTSQKHGYSAKVFDVEMVENPLLTGTPRLNLRETDPLDTAWSIDYELPVSTPPLRVTQPSPQGVNGFALEKWSVQGAGGALRPALRMSWNGDQPDVRGLAWEVRLKDGATIATGSYQDVPRSDLIISEGVLPAVTYQGRAKFIVNRATVWSDWEEATTDDLRLTAADMADALAAKIDTAFDRHDAAIADALGTVGDLRDRVLGHLGNLGDLSVPLINPLQPLDRIVAQQLPALRTVQDAAAEAEDAAIFAAIDGFMFRQQMTDAGVYVSPSTGRVEIRGIASLADRQSSVEITLDAMTSEIALKATTAYVDNAIIEAVLDPSQIPIIGDIETRLSAAELTLDGATGDITTLSATLTVEGDLVTMSEVTSRLSSAENELALKVSTATFGDLEARTEDVEITLGTVDIPGIAFSVSATSQLREQSNLTDDARVIDLIRSWQGDQAAREASASGRREITAYVDGVRQAQAQEIAELSARAADSEAALATEALTRAWADDAEAALREALSAQVNHPTTGLPQTRADLASEQSARANADSAIASDVTSLTARMGTAEGDIGLVDAALATEQSARVNADSAIASVVTSLTSRMGTAEGDISSLAATRVTASGAVAAVNQEISASYGDLEALATATSFAEATATGITEGFIWRTAAGGVIELVSVSGGTGGSVTTAKIAADYIQLTGITQINTAVIAELVTTDAFLENLEVTGNLIVRGAVSTTKVVIGKTAGATLSSNTAFEMVSDDHVFDAGSFEALDFPWRGSPASNPLKVDLAFEATAGGASATSVEVRVEGVTVGDIWSSLAVFYIDIPGGASRRRHYASFGLVGLAAPAFVVEDMTKVRITARLKGTTNPAYIYSATAVLSQVNR